MTDPIFILLVGIVIVVGGIIGLKLHPFLALLLAAVAVALLTPVMAVEQFYLAKGTAAAEALKLSQKSIGERIGTEFGNTCAKIGILIAMAAIIGKSMLDSGSAEKNNQGHVKSYWRKKCCCWFYFKQFLLNYSCFCRYRYFPNDAIS